MNVLISFRAQCLCNTSSSNLVKFSATVALLVLLNLAMPSRLLLLKMSCRVPLKFNFGAGLLLVLGASLRASLMPFSRGLICTFFDLQMILRSWQKDNFLMICQNFAIDFDRSTLMTPLFPVSMVLLASSKLGMPPCLLFLKMSHREALKFNFDGVLLFVLDFNKIVLDAIFHAVWSARFSIFR